jgi:tRNA A-37 threonylcarbamoyl transferase component Bud32
MDVGERYVLGRLVGEGATAFVHEAQDTLLQREVAVKVFRDADLGDGRSERISEEVRILTALTHPHLLPLYDTGRDADGRRFLVMPLVRGTTLARLVARGPVPPREVKRIGAALAEALAHIHARGVVHRDVKPSNVLLDHDGTPYLADFGFAHAEDGPALTATNCVVGTAGYLAPEQAEGAAVTPATDVYALGLVLLEALTGERAYRGTPLERAVANALKPPAIPARLGAGWLAVLRALTAREAAARPPAERVPELLLGAEDELPQVTAVDATMELTPVLFEAPDHPVPALTVASPGDEGEESGRGATAVDGAIAVTGAGAVLGAEAVAGASGSDAGGASAGSKAAASTASGAGTLTASRLRHAPRRLATVGMAALAATAFLGVGAGTHWLSSGAGAAPADPARQPPSATPSAAETPGAGAAGTPQGSAATPSQVTVSVPVSASGTVPAVRNSVFPASDVQRPADQVLTGPAKCRADAGPDGGHGDGHGKHKCAGGDPGPGGGGSR